MATARASMHSAADARNWRYTQGVTLAAHHDAIVQRCASSIWADPEKGAHFLDCLSPCPAGSDKSSDTGSHTHLSLGASTVMLVSGLGMTWVPPDRDVMAVLRSPRLGSLAAAPSNVVSHCAATTHIG